MPPQTIEIGVERLEQRVTELERLPDRVTAVESQIVQLRAEMHDEFSAVRQEFAGLRQEFADLRRTIDTRIDETQRYMRVLHEEVIGRIATVQEGQQTKRRGRPKKG